VKVQAIIPIAGVGQRLKADLPKPFVEIYGKPLCVHALEVFQACSMIDSMILVGHADHLSKFKGIVKTYGLSKVKKIIAGGETRCASVSHGLKELDHDTDIIVVHDGVRPLVSGETIRDAVKLLEEWKAVVVAVPVKSTIKKSGKKDLVVAETVDRADLWEVQTPQVFRRDVLLKAHAENQDDAPTDDAMMVERLGIKVKILPGDYRNIKVTTQEDLTVAEAFLKNNKGGKI
jgi:2-C-methyl-D-erythritol 4-phosphate cytidylyltransferase